MYMKKNSQTNNSRLSVSAIQKRKVAVVNILKVDFAGYENESSYIVRTISVHFREMKRRETNIQ